MAAPKPTIFLIYGEDKRWQWHNLPSVNHLRPVFVYDDLASGVRDLRDYYDNMIENCIIFLLFASVAALITLLLVLLTGDGAVALYYAVVIVIAALISLWLIYCIEHQAVTSFTRIYKKSQQNKAPLFIIERAKTRPRDNLVAIDLQDLADAKRVAVMLEPLFKVAIFNGAQVDLVTLDTCFAICR